MASTDDRPLTEWAVLALVAEGRTHGFEVARVLAEQGDVGRVWTVRRPLVYRALDSLVRDGLVVEVGTQGGRGPSRRMVEVTAEGRRAARRWVESPVAHVRDIRTAFFVKLALLDRAGRSRVRLVERQQRTLAPTLAALRTSAASESQGFDAVVASWRRASAEAVADFLRTL